MTDTATVGAADYAPTDGFFGAPYVDVDEAREIPAPHRYIHGGFNNTDTRFSIYLPPQEQYRQRLLMVDVGGPGGNEHIATSGIGAGGMIAAFAAGCYLVETNQGHIGADMSGIRGEPSVLQWRANAEAARFSRTVAAQVYGGAPRFGYCQAERALHALENAPDVFHGAVSDNLFHQSQGTFFSMLTNALRLLGPKLADVADAMSVGGSGDPFVGLDSAQREALALIYKTGFPRGAEFWLLDSFESAIVVPMNMAEIDQHDAQYFDDFWHKSGYAGCDDGGQLGAARKRTNCRVTRLVSAAEVIAAVGRPGSGLAVAANIIARLWNRPEAPVGICVDGAVGTDIAFSALTFASGAASGQSVFCCGALGDILLWNSGPTGSSPALAQIRPGDTVEIDNSKYLAYCYWYRHQVDPAYPQWETLMLDGKPLFPQRPRREAVLSGTYQYDFAGKLIIVRGATDAGVWPCGAADYVERVRARYGAKADEKVRLYWLEHAAHGVPQSMPPGPPPVLTTRLIDHQGAARQALFDLIEWVERGESPPPSTGFSMTAQQRLELAPPARRGGVQPQVTLSANGKAGRADVRLGEKVLFEAQVSVPAHAGYLAAARWDFDGRGLWPRQETLSGESSAAVFTAEHVFDQPGTYFPALLVSARRGHREPAEFFLTHNLGRIRVVVS